jgi:glyoxylase-like metal-dependent hydrolase (beta-lactamase superfamily II)
MLMATQPQEIAPGVFYIEAGKGITRSNVYFVRSGSSWVLIDTASAHCGPVIQEAAESLFGAHTPPAAILLTHVYPDHAGSTLELTRRWGCLAYVHPDELPFATADLSNFFSTYTAYTTSAGRWTPPPLDRWVILPMVRALPRRRRESMLTESSFKDVARAFDPAAGLPGLADWECISTPGHTPGHVSFFRSSDRVLITGDALVTVNLNSLWGFLLWGVRRNKQILSGPPWYTTWSWRAAKESVASVARVEPRVLATGHGLPMTGPTTARDVRAFADHFR